MKKSKKLLLATLVLATAFGAGAVAACSPNDPPDSSSSSSSQGGVDTLEVVLVSTLSLMEGQVSTLDFTSNVNKSEFAQIQWNSSATGVLTAVKQSDGSVQLTAVAPGQSTLTLRILHGGQLKSYTCAVTVTEYANADLRVFYNVDTTATAYEASMDQPADGYAYGAEAQLSIKPTAGYLFTSVNVGEERYEASEFTKNADGSYSLVFDVLEKPTGTETELSVDVTVNAGQIQVTKTNSAYTEITGLPTTYSMDEEVSFTVAYNSSVTDESDYIKTVWFNGEELTATEGTYKFSVTQAVNTLEIKAGEKHRSGKIQVVTNGAAYSENNPMKTASNKGVMVTSFGYSAAKGNDPYCFGIRVYPGDTYTGLAHFEIYWDGTNLTFIDEKTATNKYTFTNVEATKQKLLDGTFGVVMVRNVNDYALYVTDGDELELAFNTTYTDEATWYRSGINVNAVTPAGNTMTYSYEYYDGETDYTPYVVVTPEVAATNATLTGLTMNGSEYEEVSLWNEITFTVTPDDGYAISSVAVNGNIIEGTATGTDGAYTYTVTVLSADSLRIEAEAVDPTAPATLSFDKHEDISIVYVEGEKTEYIATNVVKFKLVSSDDFRNVKNVTVGGATLEPVDGVYTLTLAAGENAVVVNSASAKVTGSAEGHRYKTASDATSWVNTLPDNVSGVSTAIESPSGTSTLVAKVQFAEANQQTAANWYIDFRFYGDTAKTKFLAISIGKNATGVYVSSRTSQLKYFKNASADANEAEVLNLLENGEFRIAIVKSSGKNFAIYADDGSGMMSYIGTLTGVGSISDTQTFEYIAFGGTNTNLSDITEGGVTKYQLATTKIDWGYYDNVTDWELAAGDFFKDAAITPTVSATNASVSGLEASYNFGDTVSFTVTPASGYAITSVKVNGKELTATDGTYTTALKSVNCQIEVTTVVDSITPTITLEGSVTQNGLLDTYQYGDTATFTVNADANATVTVTVNGEVITPVGGTYSFTVGSRADVIIRAVNQAKSTVVLSYDGEAFTVSGVDTTVDHYDVGAEVTLTVGIAQFNGAILSGVTLNGTALTAEADGTYKATLVAGDNTFALTAASASATGTATAKAATSLGNDLYEGSTSKVITASAGSATIVTLSYDGAETNANAWRVEYRIHDSNFVAFGLENKSTGLVFQNRSSGVTLYTFTTAEAEYVKAQLVAGTLVSVIEKTDTGYAFYVATAAGTLTKMGDAARTTTGSIQYGIGNRNVLTGEQVVAKFYTYNSTNAEAAKLSAALMAK